MGWKEDFLSPGNFVGSHRIYVAENARRASIPKSIVELRFPSQLIRTVHSRQEQSLYFFFRSVDRIHIDCVLPIVGTEFHEVIFVSDYIGNLELIHESWKRIERFPLLFADFR